MTSIGFFSSATNDSKLGQRIQLWKTAFLVTGLTFSGISPLIFSYRLGHKKKVILDETRRILSCENEPPFQLLKIRKILIEKIRQYGLLLQELGTLQETINNLTQELDRNIPRNSDPQHPSAISDTHKIEAEKKAMRELNEAKRTIISLGNDMNLLENDISKLIEKHQSIFGTIQTHHIPSFLETLFQEKEAFEKFIQRKNASHGGPANARVPQEDPSDTNEELTTQIHSVQP